MTYPTDWPKCLICETAPRLDGHLTCGQASCSESQARDLRDRAAAILDAGEQALKATRGATSDEQARAFLKATDRFFQ